MIYALMNFLDLCRFILTYDFPLIIVLIYENQLLSFEYLEFPYMNPHVWFICLHASS